MEEEKAAAYYDELVRKGGNAAKYKQGLGFGGSQSSRPKDEGYGSLSNFVKSSPGRTAALEKETRVDSIRDKLKKKDENNSSRKRSPEKDRRTDREKSDYREHRRRKSPESQTEVRRREKSSRHRSLSSEDIDRTVVRKAGSHRQRRSRSRSPGRRSTSPKSRARSETTEKDFTLKRRELEQRNSRSPSHGSSGTSSERTRKRSRRSKKDRSTSPGDDSRRSMRRRSPETSGRSRRTCSRSVERRRDRSRSRSRGNDADRRSSRRKDSCSSPKGSRRRERSRSPVSRRFSSWSRDDRYRGRGYDRSSGYRTNSSTRRYENERRGEKSYRDRDRRPEEKSRLAPEKIQERDFSKLIPNFESMTPAEKVKAKMKLQLSETVVKDKAKGMSDEWERFDFNKDAPLDDDAKQDYFGDGTGARDDTEFLKNTGSTFFSSSNQVTREAQVQSVHENAIFGPPQGLRIRVLEPEVQLIVEKNSYDDDSEDQPIIVEDSNVSRKDESPHEPCMDTGHAASTVVSQQVIAMQQAGSWQERARKMREARAALDS